MFWRYTITNAVSLMKKALASSPKAWYSATQKIWQEVVMEHLSGPTPKGSEILNQEEPMNDEPFCD